MIETSAAAITPNCDYDILVDELLSVSDCGNNSRKPVNGEQATFFPVGSHGDPHSREYSHCWML